MALLWLLCLFLSFIKPYEEYLVNDLPTRIVPKPHHYQSGTTKYIIDERSFMFQFNKRPPLMLTLALQRAYHNCFPVSSNHRNINKYYSIALKLISVDFTDDSSVGNHTLGIDESYYIRIENATARLDSKTIWGLLKGLQSFCQSVYLNSEQLYEVQDVYIADMPRFQYRGLLLDTSRHYLTIDTIKKHMDLMEIAKLNVLHWHIVDDDSFPYVSLKFDNLHKQGAFKSNMVYPPQIIQEIVIYGRMRGILVMPEFDNPGHMYSWRGQKDLLTICDKKIQGIFNPSLKENYAFISDFFLETRSVFHNNLIHFGGDEVDSSYWENNSTIKNWMSRHNLVDGNEVEKYHAEKLISMLSSGYHYSFFWQEVFERNTTLGKSQIISVWKSNWKTLSKQIMEKKNKMVLYSCWYLNNFDSYEQWPTYYSCDPMDFPGSDAKLVLGGAVSMWGELINDSVSLERTWIRSVPAAERFWSSSVTTDVIDASNRFFQFFCFLQKRGYNVADIEKSRECP